MKLSSFWIVIGTVLLSVLCGMANLKYMRQSSEVLLPFILSLSITGLISSVTLLWFWSKVGGNAENAPKGWVVLWGIALLPSLMGSAFNISDWNQVILPGRPAATALAVALDSSFFTVVITGAVIFAVHRFTLWKKSDQ